MCLRELATLALALFEQALLLRAQLRRFLLGRGRLLP